MHDMLEMGCGACKENELGSLSSFLHSLYVWNPWGGPGTVPGDGDIRMNKTWVLPQEKFSKGEELISKYITNQCGKCSERDMPRSWEHMIMVKSGECLTQAGSGRWRHQGRLSQLA